MGSGVSEIYNGTHGSTNRLPKNDAQIKHIFRKDDGHLVDSPKNRKTLERIANDKSLFWGTDKHRKDWYIEKFKNGGQHWVTVKNGRIQDGGYNRSPIEWNPDTGLCAPTRPTVKPKKKGDK